MWLNRWPVLPLAFIVTAFGIFDGVHPQFPLDTCIDREVCTCGETTLECACPVTSPKRNLTIFSFTIHRVFNSIRVDGCHQVLLKTLALSSYPPAQFLASGVGNLFFQSYVFHMVKDIRRIVISDSRIANLDEQAFCDISALERLEFRNVTVDWIRPRAFAALSDIETIAFRDCIIGEVSSEAFFNVTRIGTFSITGAATTIRRLKSSAIVLKDVGRLEFFGATVEMWDSKAVAVARASHVVLEECQVAKMGDAALVTLLTTQGEVVFAKNTFESVSPGAFDGLGDANVSFWGNTLLQVNSASSSGHDPQDGFFLGPLLAPPGSGGRIGFRHVQNNSFPCDDNLCWMLEEQEEYGGDIDGGGGLARASTDSDIMSNSRRLLSAAFQQNFCANWNASQILTLASFASMMDDEDLCPGGHSSGTNKGNAAIATTFSGPSWSDTVSDSAMRCDVSFGTVQILMITASFALYITAMKLSENGL